jgi:hypothetical protein
MSIKSTRRLVFSSSQQNRFVPSLDFLLETVAESIQHSTISAIRSHFQVREEQSRARQASTLIVTIDNNYGYTSSEDIFKLNITFSLPELVDYVIIFSLPVTDVKLYSVLQSSREQGLLSPGDLDQQVLQDSFKDMSKPLVWQRTARQSTATETIFIGPLGSQFPLELAGPKDHGSVPICLFDMYVHLREDFCFEDSHGLETQWGWKRAVGAAASERVRWRIEGRSGQVRYQLPIRKIPSTDEMVELAKLDQAAVEKMRSRLREELAGRSRRFTRVTPNGAKPDTSRSGDWGLRA